VFYLICLVCLFSELIFLILTSFPAYLNRQIIILLSNLGIPDAAFERLQDDMMQLLDAMLTDDGAARTILKCMPDQHDFSTTAIKMLKVQVLFVTFSWVSCTKTLDTFPCCSKVRKI
jgi:hypothetical protein